MSAPILSAYDWEMSQGFVRHLRAGFLDNVNNGKLQYRYVYPDGTVEWRDLLDALSSVNFNFASWWSGDANPNKPPGYLQSLLLFVNGQSLIYEWSGGITTLLSTGNSAGVISTINTGVTPTFFLPNTYGGKNYVVDDILTLTGGGANATVRVLTVNDGAITGVNVTPTAPGTGYTAGHRLGVIQTGANNGVLYIDTVDGGGGVLTVSIRSQGHGYSAASGLATDALGGGGTGCTVEITQVDSGAVATVQLVDNGTGYSVASAIPVTGGHGTGALMEILTVSNNTITKQGTDSWAQEGFYSFGTHGVVINGVTYTATGGWGTTTLTGVTPDPTGAGVAGDVIHQAVETVPNSSIPNLDDTFENDLIEVFNDQLYLGSLISNVIPVSEVGDYRDFTFTFPRLSGNGIQLIANAPPKAFIIQEDLMYVSAGINQWYTISIDTVSTDVSDIVGLVVVNVITPTLHRLKTAGLQGAQSQAFVNKNKNDVIYVSFEPIVNSLGRVENILVTPQISDLSFPIVNDMNSYNFTDGCIVFWQNFIIVAVPKENLIRLYNMTKDTSTQNPTNDPIHYWEAPLTMPLSRFSIIDGELYGHSYLVSETYKLFEGYNFNGQPIPAAAIFAYQQFGVRPQNKSENEFYIEGYISPNTTLDVTINYDLDGTSGQYNGTIDGTDTQIVQTTGGLNSLGKESLGKNPIGGDLEIDITPTNKFRVIKTFPRTPYYEASPGFSSIGVDYIWSLIAFGPAQMPTSEGNNPITQ